MGELAVVLAAIGVAGPLVLGVLLFGELRGGEPRLSARLVLASLQVLVGTWSLGVFAAAFLFEPWLAQRADETLASTAHSIANTAAFAAFLWLPAAAALLVLFVRALHRGELDRLQLPLTAIVLYGAALVWGASRFMTA